MKYLLRPEFRLPLIVLGLLALGVLAPLPYFWMAAIVFGIAKIIVDSVRKIRSGEYSLDYIAFLAMAVSLFADQYLAGAIVALMITGGESLDEYASHRAEGALRALVERIPKSCTVRTADGSTKDRPIQDVGSGEIIVVRPNELIPLDGTLRSAQAELNEANLTGEALPVTFRKGSFIKSGSINVGETLELLVESGFENSTYMRIVHLVDEAKKYQAPVVRLAEQVNFPFTAIAIALAAGAYLFSGELSRALAVLVIATPCPLIIAAPVAFIGGLSRAARSNIIVKRPATLEELSRANVIFFDKTGTLTLGEPALKSVDILVPTYKESDILAIASAIEFHSIHPLARAVLTARASRDVKMLEARHVVETVGKGIAGDVEGARYTIRKGPEGGLPGQGGGITLSLCKEDAEIARFRFEDIIKENVADLFHTLAARGIRMEILTGDRRENAERLFGHYGIPIHAECTPESKFAIIDEAKKGGHTVVMVGDGLNDAPALAHANVGVVFSGTENSAAIEAANAVILGRDVALIAELFDTSAHAMKVARQSIFGGVVLSTLGMIAASFGFIIPVAGAITQEAIDVAVIFNSLRAAGRR